MDASVAVARRLFHASPKVAMRLLREQLKEYCSSTGSAYLDIELVFQKTRSALTHLSNNASFADPLEEKLEELINLTRTLTTHPDKLWSVRQLAKVERTTDDLEHVLLTMKRRGHDVTQDEIEMFITIVNGLRDRYLGEAYEPADAADPVIYALAQLIAANYEAYDRTLNEK